MKRSLRVVISFISGSVLVLSMLGFVCEGDQGPAGPPGTAECFNCHTDDYAMTRQIRPYQQGYSVSQHGTGDTWVRKGDPCSRCHTNEGHQIYLETGTPTEISQASRIGCFTCHAPHTNFDFSRRQTAPVTFDWGTGTYDKEESNTCVVCHQARVPDPVIAVGDTIESSRWGPHHGPQANTLNGVGAYEFSGTYPSNHPHNTMIADGCVNCHMAEMPESGDAGDHTFSVTYEYHGEEEINSNGCVICHTGWDDEDAAEEVEEVLDDFELELDDLKWDLFALGWVDSSGSVVTPLVITNEDDAGALFNFRLLLEEHCAPVHNPVYAAAVLEATQEYIDTRAPLARR